MEPFKWTADPYVKQILQAIQKTPGIPSILPRTLADYMRGWKKA